MKEDFRRIQLTNNPEDAVLVPARCANCPRLEAVLGGAKQVFGEFRYAAKRPEDSSLATLIVTRLVDEGYSAAEAEEGLKPALGEIGWLSARLLEKGLVGLQDDIKDKTARCPGVKKIRATNKDGSQITVSICESGEANIGLDGAPNIEVARVERTNR